MSSVNSAMSSRQSSRGTTPLPEEIPQVNPYRLPRFWRGFVVGGLTIPGLYGLYKLGSLAKDYYNDKFHRRPENLPAIAPNAHNQQLVLHHNRHY